MKGKDIRLRSALWSLIPCCRYEGVIFSNMSTTTQVQETVDAKYLFPLAGPSVLLSTVSAVSNGRATTRLSTKGRRGSATSSLTVQRTTWPSTRLRGIRIGLRYGNLHSTPGRSSTAQQHHSSVPTRPAFPDANNQTIAQIMSSYWISFAVTGDPEPDEDV